jgi:hypothetical protein
MDKITNLQIELCKLYGAPYSEVTNNEIMGISKNVTTNNIIHGLRHSRSEDTSGWYIWSGEYSEKSNFFEPIHISHIMKNIPQLYKFLALPPGWRFMYDPINGYEDVWRDEKLILDIIN